LSTNAAQAGQLTTPAPEGDSPAAGLPWHASSHQPDRYAAGYQDAMLQIIDLALHLAARPDSTAQNTLHGVIELALSVIKLDQPDQAAPSASHDQAL
jgi:hypothetical protein